MHSGIQLYNLSLVSHIAYHQTISQWKANTLRVKLAKEICLNCGLQPKQATVIGGTVATWD